MFIFLAIFWYLSSEDSPKKPVIIPQPLKFQLNEGYFLLDSDTGISYDSTFPNLSNIVNYIKTWIYGATQFNLKVLSSPMNVGIVFDTPNKLRNGFKSMESEEYSLNITKDRVLIISSSYNGFYYGFTTFLQLLPPQIFNLDPDIECSLVDTEECRKYDWEPNKGVEWISPCVEVSDKPRFSYRGVLLDTSRHFFRVDVIKRLIRIISILKINHLQLHLTDDQGNRFESIKYPGLQTFGSIRKSSPKKWDDTSSDGTQYGPFFYTQDELRDLVKYSSQLGVTIVPDFELPGHALGSLAPYSQYSCRQQPLNVACKWGSSLEIFCVGNDEAIQFLEDIFTEIFDIFPSKFVHIGGDEVIKSRWRFCTKCKNKMIKEGLSDVSELQSWIVTHFSNFFDQKGRRLVGWGEILDGGKNLSQKAVIMNWKGIQAAIEGTQKGHNTIDGSRNHFYFNFKQFPADDIYEYNTPQRFVPFWYTYTKDPLYMINENNSNLVLGVQGAAWSEYIWDDENDLHYKLFPRTTALSEIGWTNNASKSWGRFYCGYVRSIRMRLKLMGVNQAPLMLHHEIGWTNKDLKSDGSFVTKSWNVSKAFTRDCSYDVAFIKTGGNKEVDLRVKNVKIFVNESEVTSFTTEKVVSFGDDEDVSGDGGAAFYRFNFDKQIDSKLEVRLQADLAPTKQSSECEGTVVVYATEFKSIDPTP